MAINANNESGLGQAAILNLIKQLEKTEGNEEIIAQLKPKLTLPKVKTVEKKNGNKKTKSVKQSWNTEKQIEISLSRTSILRISLSKGDTDGTRIVGERKFYKNKDGEVRATKDGFAILATKEKIDEQIKALNAIKAML
jgi:hypothetical protein